MKTKNALIRCILGVVVASAMLVVTWSTTSARFSPNTTTTTVGSSSKVAPPVLSNFTRIPFRNILTPATIATDQSDYQPGDHVTVTGSGFLAGETVSLTFIEDPNHDGPHMLSTIADDSGNISDNNFIVDPEDVNTAFTLNAVGLSSRQTATTTFTDSPPAQGHGTVTNVVGVGGSCVTFTPAQSGGPDNWEIVEGGTYTVTITGVTECTDPTITVFLQSSSVGNHCFNATGGSGTYTGTVTIANPACNTMPISYKCGGNAPCNSQNTFRANGPSGANSVHFRASTFDSSSGSCMKTGNDTTCTGGGGGQGLEFTCSNDITTCACGDTTVTYDAPHVTGGGTAPYSSTCTPPSGSTFEVGTTQVHCSIHDSSTPQLTGDCFFDVTINKDTPKIDTCPADVIVECGSPTDPEHTGGPATGSSTCSAVTISHSDVEAPGNCTNKVVKTITRTWKATNGCQAEATCTQTITVKDTTAPTIGSPGSNGSVECPATPVFTPPTAQDSCDPNPQVIPLTPDERTEGSCPGTYSLKRTWKARDACGNESGTVSQTINVVDTTAPSIACSNVTVQLLPGDTCPAQVSYQVTANDTCSGVRSIDCTPPAGTTFYPGTTPVMCTASDRCNNTSAPCQFSVTVYTAICGTKFYDANANGQNDDGQVVGGFKIVLSGAASSTVYTDNSNSSNRGKYCFLGLLPGNYTVTEVAPNASWQNTTPTSYTFALTCPVTKDFGNYCFKAPANGLTLGFWSNKNGENILKGHDTDAVNWRAKLNSLNLRNANGTLYTVPTGSFSTAYASFSNWLLGATATNMAYMLSAQLATTTLDTCYNGLSDSQGIIVPGGVKTQANVCIVPFLSVTQTLPPVGSCAALNQPLVALTAVPGSTACGCNSNNGLVTVGALRNAAIALLCSYGNTTASGTARTYEECVKDLLDMINNNGNPPGSSAYPCGPLTQYINPGPGSCPITSPY